MTANFQLADWLFCAFAVVMATLGLFRGFSGTLGFVLALATAGAVATFGWPLSADLTPVVWQRAAGLLVATLVAFGIVRLVVKKLVNGLLAGPSDALFGLLVGGGIAALVLTAWAWSGFHLEYSYLAQSVAAYVR